jgi:signal transduction histidine kinase/ActR/RegA family two-component response regulator
MSDRTGETIQQLIANIASDMLAKPLDDIAASACGALEQLGRAAHVERVYIFLLNDEGNAIEDIHEWCASGVGAHDYDALRGVTTDVFPWSMSQWLRGETIRVVDPDELPEEAAPERSACDAMTILSYINVPLFENGRLVGWLGYDSVYEHRDWEDAEPLISVAGDIITAALMRKRREILRLREHEVDARGVSMGMLAAGLAHEINNPLSYTFGNLELIEQALLRGDWSHSPDLREELLEYVREALDGTNRVAKIVDDLKALVRGEDTESGAVDVADVIAAALRMANNWLRHKAQVVSEIAAPLPAAVGTNTKLGQVIVNLLMNAAEALPEGASADHTIRVSAEADDENVLIKISDSGQGIPEAYRDRLFDPFFTSRPGVGMGMGLAVCKHIVRGFGGALRIISDVGAGTTVTVILPRVEKDDAPNGTTARAKRIGVGRLRLLVVDDEESVLLMLGKHLAAHETVLLGSGCEAIEFLEEDRDFDAIVCDVQMGDYSGIQVHAKVATIDPDLAQRMVFITGGAFTDAARQFLDEPGRNVLFKPFMAEDLRNAVDVAASAKFGRVDRSADAAS